MKSVSEVVQILLKNIPDSCVISCKVEEANSMVLAQDMLSPINMPPFRQSAMDGYALHVIEGLNYEIIGEIKAGDREVINLLPGQAVKIFTGAAVPDSANSVIQIEKVNTDNACLSLFEAAKINSNIRPIGEQIKIHNLALPKDTILNAAAIGFLCGLGITEVSVYRKPSVGILITGNELVERGTNLAIGEIYESNATMLTMALQSHRFFTLKKYRVSDHLDLTTQTIQKAVKENDIVLISGGISVGDYDFVARALSLLNFEILFEKVNQQPGKPFCTAKKGNEMVFALPGNPAAALTCFYVYVLPFLKTIAGHQKQFFKTVKRKLSDDKLVNNNRDQFFKASMNEEEVELLSHQNSSMLNSFAQANALAYVPAGNYQLSKNEYIELIPID